MRRLSTAVTIVLAAASLTATVSLSHAQSCQALWVERNQLYKNGGYCFHTTRAINYFGNAGCRYYFEAAVPLSRAARSRIAAITRAERNLGCGG